MSVYKSTALLNLTGMVRGAGILDDNDLFHWYKHAALRFGLGFPSQPDVKNVPSEDDYIALARAICREAADGKAGTEVRYRDAIRQSSNATNASYIVWYQKDPTIDGLFLAVKDCHDHGELITMFSPDDGYLYFEREADKGAILPQ